MFGLWENETVVGFAQLTDKKDGVYELEKLAVLPEYRHKGYGAQLLTFICDQAQTLGGNKITIGIIEENTRLKNWYLQNGFTHMGTRKFAHLPFTVGFMEREINGL